LCLLLAGALVACSRYSRSTGGTSSLEKQVLYDFRAESPATQPAQNNRIVSAAFPTSVTEAGQCKAGDTAKNRTIARIVSQAEGSFTAPGTHQAAYLVDIASCGQDPTSSMQRLLIADASGMISNLEAPLGTTILSTYDLNHDGVSELLLGGVTAGQGAVRKTASLVEFEKGKLRTLEDFGQVYENPCQRDPQGTMTALVVNYLPLGHETMPKFSAELHRSRCFPPGHEPEWVRVGAR
jgi:hypothetical protein